THTHTHSSEYTHTHTAQSAHTHTQLRVQITSELGDLRIPESRCTGISCFDTHFTHTHTHTQTQKHTHTEQLTHTHTHTLTLPCTHRHTHTHSTLHTHTHTHYTWMKLCAEKRSALHNLFFCPPLRVLPTFSFTASIPSFPFFISVSFSRICLWIFVLLCHSSCVCVCACVRVCVRVCVCACVCVCESVR